MSEIISKVKCYRFELGNLLDKVNLSLGKSME